MHSLVRGVVMRVAMRTIGRWEAKGIGSLGVVVEADVDGGAASDGEVEGVGGMGVVVGAGFGCCF